MEPGLPRTSTEFAAASAAPSVSVEPAAPELDIWNSVAPRIVTVAPESVAAEYAALSLNVAMTPPRITSPYPIGAEAEAE